MIYRKRPADPDFIDFAALDGTIVPLYDVTGNLFILHKPTYLRTHLCEVADVITKRLEFTLTYTIAAAFESATTLLIGDERVIVAPSGGSGGISKGRLINNA